MGALSGVLLQGSLLLNSLLASEVKKWNAYALPGLDADVARRHIYRASAPPQPLKTTSRRSSSFRRLNIRSMLALTTQAMLEEVCNFLPLKSVAKSKPLAEARQFVRLMTGAERLEQLAAAKDPVAALEADFPALRPHRLAALLDKYKEVGIAATLFAGRSASAEAQKHPKKKTVEAFAKRLRAAKA